MCGICGIIKDHINGEDRIKTRIMTRALIHRGPDSEGYFADDQVALGMRRLKIIDLASGDQPLYNEDKTIVLIVNGEIYNYVELRKKLISQGHNFLTKTDGEVIIHAYEEHGPAFIDQLRGMFSFCLYDRIRKKIIIARDRLAEKPLYIFQADKQIIFSSEMKSIIKIIDKKRINLPALDFFFTCQYIKEPETLVTGVKKLAAAHCLVGNLRDLSFRIEKYWDPLNCRPIDSNPESAIRDSLEDIMAKIIHADVPVGISLSGGLDSGIVALLASRHAKKIAHAFTVGYPGHPANDERKKAGRLAQQLGLKLHESEITKNELIKDFPKLVYALDDPIGDIAAYGYFRAMKLAREHNIPVILNGIGGDELFWGYEWVNDIVKKARFLLKFGFLLQRFDFRPAGRSHLFSRYLDHYRRDQFVFKHIYHPEFKNRLKKDILPAFSLPEYKNKIDLKVINELFDLWLYPNCTALNDRLSMAWSIELRSPFLDRRVVETALGIINAHRHDYKLPYKKRLKDAFRDIMPAEILNREKRGFEPPVREWLTAIIEKYYECLSDGWLVKNSILDGKILGRVRRIRKNYTIDNFIYRAILFEIWRTTMLENRS